MSDVVHQSVLPDEVLAQLAPLAPGMRLLDATVGAGGHSARLLERCSACELLGIDADARMLDRAREVLTGFESVTLVQGWFDEVIPAVGMFDRILFDLGISMVHVRDAQLGFSFRENGPLDMRLNRSPATATLDEVLAGIAPDDLTAAIGRYGEERYAGRIARAILREHRAGRLSGTRDLAETIARAVPPAYRHSRTHPATRTFQALRIMVNQELSRIERALPLAVDALRPGGRLAVISFHSLEDRIVKHTFRAIAVASSGSPAAPGAPGRGAGDSTSPAGTPMIENRAVYRVVTRKPIVPGEAEVARNPAARSAKLRVLERAEE